MKIVVLGNRGMLGTDLCRAFVPLGEVVGLDKEEVDVTDAAVVTKVIAEHKPDLVVNATGYTDVDGAEGNRELAFTLNDEAVKNIAAAASKVGARLVHFSTEYVFSGIEHDGYDEAAAPNPVNVYGQSKAVGERHVVAYERGYLVRTSWLYGKAPQRGKPRGMNFIDTVLKLAVEKPEVRVVADQFGKLTSTRDLALAVSELVVGSYGPGIYHLVNEGVASWYDVASEVFKLKGVTTPLVPISSADYPMPARRPQYGILVNTKFPLLRPWPEALRDYLLL